MTNDFFSGAPSPDPFHPSSLRYCHLIARTILEKSSLHTRDPFLPLSRCHWELIDRLVISDSDRAITTHCDGSLPSKSLGFRSSKPMQIKFLLSAKSLRIGFKSRLRFDMWNARKPPVANFDR